MRLVNTGIAANPLNWVTVFLMTVIFIAAVDLIGRFTFKPAE